MEPLPGPTNAFVVRFTRRKAPVDLIYELGGTTAFASWQTGAAVSQELLPPIDNGDGVTETARFLILPDATDGAQRFIRLGVRLAP
jgi:hypothetical protein